jgi:inner membrane protein
MFIIDPLYTLPLLAGVIVALVRRDGRGLPANRWGLALSTAYLAWSAGAQASVHNGAEAALQSQGLKPDALLVTPAPFNTVLWRIVAITPDGRYHEGFRSLLDAEDRPWRFDAFDQGLQWWPLVEGGWHAERMRWFTHGLYKLERRDGGIVLSDLRMGQEPAYVFAFRLPLTHPEPGLAQPALPQAVGQRGDVGRGLRWLGPRMLGADVPPPR